VKLRQIRQFRRRYCSLPAEVTSLPHSAIRRLAIRRSRHDL
jgi:hypothetical protein